LLALRVRGHLLVTSPPGARAFEIKDENSFGKRKKNGSKRVDTIFRQYSDLRVSVIVCGFEIRDARQVFST
jgi:hypothetical protein